MSKILGQSELGLVVCQNTPSLQIQQGPSSLPISVVQLNRDKSKGRQSKQSKNFKIPLNSKRSSVVHVSIQQLNRETQGDEQSSKRNNEGGVAVGVYLVGVVQVEEASSAILYPLGKYSASLHLLKESGEPLGEVNLLRNCRSELKLHILATKTNEKDLDLDTLDGDNDENQGHQMICRNRVLLLQLDEGGTMYEVETELGADWARCEVLSSELVTKGFWWAQWVPSQESLAFAHIRQPRLSYDDEETFASPVAKQLFSVLQFHHSYPRESVLNMPLEMDTTTCRTLGQLVPDPLILNSKSNNAQMKLLAHSSGAVSIFQILPSSTNDSNEQEEEKIGYSLNLLHHNKTLDVQVNLPQGTKPLLFDVALFSSDQYVVVVGWPHFVHLLDCGTTHEPSHHLLFTLEDLLGKNNSSPFLSLASCHYLNSTNSNGAQLLSGGGGGGAFREDKSEKCDQSSKSGLSVLFSDLCHSPLELNSGLLLPLLEAGSSTFKLGVLHHFLIHSGDINVAKRIIYDEGKKHGNLHVKEIYQEFLIGYAHLQTKKQILPNMDSFLNLIPYSPNPDSEYLVDVGGMRTQMWLKSNATEVSTMLLSPSQRVFPHNITDAWTSLWHINRQFTKGRRFNHKHIAEKLLLSLQCYKPEALSRANTPGPMSPSSPLICSSLGDIAGMFGRRATELQLPFLEQESCTANKQEYVFSINLRELSMHLLKERKEWPLHGHTVAGKYVCALGDTARLLCHLLCLTVHLQPTKNRDKGFKLVDTLDWETRLKLFMLMEMYALALGTLACPLPQGFTPFFAYLGYRVLKYHQFLWHVRSGTFDLQIDLVKTIMADLKDSDEGNVAKKLQLLTLLPKTRANRVLNSWSHPISVCLRARQHSSDLLSGVASQNRKRIYTTTTDKKKRQNSTDNGGANRQINPLDTFFQLLTGKANASDIDLGLLTEATMISMEECHLESLAN